MDAGRRSGEEPRVDALETSLHELQEDLKLSTQQEPLWQAYADKVRALASDVARERGRRPAADAGTLLQRIDRVVDAARNRLTALEEIGLAAKALFESLSPEQKTPADPRLASARGPGRPSGVRPAGRLDVGRQHPLPALGPAGGTDGQHHVFQRHPDAGGGAARLGGAVKSPAIDATRGTDSSRDSPRPIPRQ